MKKILIAALSAIATLSFVSCKDFLETNPTSSVSDNQVFTSIQGANAALPIWGIWMKKCLADPTIGWSMDDDHFLAPTGGALQYNCATDGTFLGGYGDDYAGQDGDNARNQEEDYYFN